MPKDAILILGSKTDREAANKVHEVWKDVTVDYRVAIASCHKHGGGQFAKFIMGIKERLIVFIGGLSLAAPGLIETIYKASGDFSRVVFAIPLDKAACSAIEDLPKETAIITSGWNQVSVTHGIINAALASAKLAAHINNHWQILQQLMVRQERILRDNPLVPDVALDDKGLIPELK